MSVTPNPALAALMRARHRKLMAEAALAAAEKLEENLNSSEHGTGVHYARLPFRSSAPGEYPVKQSGELVAGVGAAQGDGTAAQVVIEDTLGKLLGLEFSPPSDNPNQPGTPKRASGGRAPMWTTMNDEETVDAMNDAMRRAPP